MIDFNRWFQQFTQPDDQMKVGADVPESVMSAGDQKRTKLAAARNGLPQAGDVGTGDEPGGRSLPMGVSEMDPAGVRERRPGERYGGQIQPEGSIRYPVDQREPGYWPSDVTDEEGLNRGQDPLYGGGGTNRYAPAPQPPGPLRPGQDSQQYMRGELERQIYRQSLQPGTDQPITNPDGSVTTERSITVTEPGLNGGRPTNIPTVWGGRIVSDDEAIDNAIRSGRPWPSFGSIDEAVSAAEQRSGDLGAGRATSVGGASVPPEVQNARPYRNRVVRGEPLDEGGVQYRQPLNAPTSGPDTFSQEQTPSPSSSAPEINDVRQYDDGPRESGYVVPADPAQYGAAGDDPGETQQNLAKPSISPEYTYANGGEPTPAAQFTELPLQRSRPQTVDAQFSNGGDLTPSGQAEAVEMPIRPLSASYNDPTAGGTLNQPLPPQQAADDSPLKPLYDLGGRIIGYVQSLPEQARQAGRQINPVQPGASYLDTVGQGVSNVAQGRTAAGQTPSDYLQGMTPSHDTRVAPEAALRDILDVGTNAPRVPGAANQAITDVADSARENFRTGSQALSDGQIAQGLFDLGAGAIDVIASPYTVAGRSIDALLPTMANGPVSMGDALTNLDLAHDIRALVQAGIKVTRPVVAALRNGTAVEDLISLASRGANAAADVVDRGLGALASGVAGAPEDGVRLLGSGVVPQARIEPSGGSIAAQRAADLQAEGKPVSSVKKWQSLANAGVDTPEDLAETLRTVPMVTAQQARELLGDRPDYLEPVAEFLLDQRRKALAGEMTPRDVAKAYYMTLMSMRSAAQEAGALEAKVGGGFRTGAGEIIPPNPQLARLDGLVNVNNGRPLGDIFTEANPRHGGREVRPESMGAAWLWTDEGQRALNAIEEGEFIPEAWERGRHARLAFGSDTVGGNGALRPLTDAEIRAGKVNMTNLPQFVDELNAGIAQLRAEGRESEIGSWLTTQAQRLNGISTGKSAFIKQLLGFGDSVTIDAREINYWLSGRGLLNKRDTSRGAELARATANWSDNRNVREALQPRIQHEVMRLRNAYPELLEGIEPEDAAHILHHWIWDKAGGSATRHTDVMTSQRLASGVVPSIGSGLRSTALTGAQGAVFGAGSESLQAQQEGRDADPGEQLRRGAIGAGLAMAMGSRAARGAAIKGARDLGSGVVGRGAGRSAEQRGAPIAMTASEEVSRLRLDKFPEPLRPAIQQAAEATGFAHDARRGVISDDAAERASDGIRRSVDEWIGKSKIGRALNTEETRALRNVVTGQAQKVDDLSREIAEAEQAGVVTDLLIARAHTEGEKLASLVSVMEGARAEAGRTLRAWRAETRPVNPADAAQRIFNKFGGGSEGRQRALDAIKEFNQIPDDDPIARAGFWARVERGGKITTPDVLTAIRYNSMLSSPRTWEVGWIGSILQAPVKIASDVLAATSRPMSGELGEAAKGTALGIQAGLRPLWETLRHGITTEQALAGQLPRGLAARASTPGGRVAGTVIDLPGRMVAAPDAFFSSVFRAAETGRLAAIRAHQAGLTGARRAEFIQNFATNTPKNQQAEIDRVVDGLMLRGDMGRIGRWASGVATKDPLIGSFVAPFMKVSYHIWTQGMDLTPLGAVGTAVDAARGAYRGVRPSHLRPLGERARYNAIGLGITGAATWQALHGNVTGAGPDDPEKRDQLRATGWQPYSVKMGDKYVSYANWGPVAVPLSLAAAYAENQQYKKKDAKPEDQMFDMAKRVSQLVTEQTFLQGIGTIMNAFEDPQRYLPQLLAQQASSLVPYGSGLNTVAQSQDDFQRRPDRASDVGVAENINQVMESRTPMNPLTPDRGDVPIAQGPLGEPIKNQQSGLMAFQPFRISQEQDNPIARVYLDAGIDIARPPSSFTVDGVKIEMTPEQQRAYQRYMGEYIQRGFSRANGASDRRRVELLKDLYEESRSEAQERIKAEIGRSEIRNRARAGAGR